MYCTVNSVRRGKTYVHHTHPVVSLISYKCCRCVSWLRYKRWDRKVKVSSISSGGISSCWIPTQKPSNYIVQKNKIKDHRRRLRINPRTCSIQEQHSNTIDRNRRQALTGNYGTIRIHGNTMNSSPRAQLEVQDVTKQKYFSKTGFTRKISPLKYSNRCNDVLTRMLFLSINPPDGSK